MSDVNDSDADDVYDDDDDDQDHNGVGGVPTAESVLEHLTRSIVDEPDAVQIDIDDSGRRAVLEVRVAPGDMGRVIGRRGRVANAIRTIVRAAAARDDAEVDVEFVD